MRKPVMLRAIQHRTLFLLCVLLLACIPSMGATAADNPAIPALPATLPSHWRTSSIQTETFKGKVFVASTGRESAPAVILIHGLGQAGLTDWLQVIPALEQDYHVIALDLPGFGRSDAPLGKYSPTNYAAVVQQVKEKFTKGPVSVVGHSMGGAVALRYAYLYPTELEKLVLVDAAGILNRTAFVKHSASAMISSSSIPTIFEGLRGVAGRYADSIMETLGQMPDPTRVLGNYQLLWGSLLVNNANVNAALALVNEDFTDAVYGNKIPTHVIWGGDDDIAPLRTGKMLAGQLQNAELLVIDNTGHVPMKSHSQEFNSHLLTALKENPRREQVATKSQGSLTCEGEGWSRHTGTYDEIVIRRCTDVVLENVVARSLIIIDSEVELDNVEIRTDRLGAIIERSHVVATNLHVTAMAGMIISDAHLDLAGVRIEARGTGIEVITPSEIIFSIGRLESGQSRTNLHGQYSARPGVLDYRLN